MVRMVCTACNFKFDRPELPRRCPYCCAGGTCQETETMYNEVFKSATGKNIHSMEKRSKKEEPEQDSEELEFY